MSPVSKEHENLLLRYMVHLQHATFDYTWSKHNSVEEKLALHILSGWDDTIKAFLSLVIWPEWGITDSGPYANDDYLDWYAWLQLKSRQIATEERIRKAESPEATLFMTVEL